jgi:NADPH2:quinone reductase
MYAIQVKAFGGPEVLQLVEVPDPEAGPGEMLIDTSIATVLWVETVIRRGDAPAYFDMAPPYTPGNGVAGVVRAVGPGVAPEWIGRAVVAHTGGGGGYAQRVAVSADGVCAIPPELETATAAALVHDGVTASAIFDRLNVGPGDRVLVVGAGGGLGIVSMHLARARGARVVATARDEAKLERLRRHGLPGIIVDSDDASWRDRVLSEFGGVDVVLDNIGGSLGEAAFELLAPQGRFSAHGTSSGRFASPDPGLVQRLGADVITIRDAQLSIEARRRLTERVLADAVAGRIRPLIGQSWPLERAAEAHAAIEDRTVIGTTQLTV